MDISFDLASNHDFYSAIKSTVNVVGLIDGEVVGGYDIRTDQSSINSIGHIGYKVETKYRNKGIGTKLCEKAIQDARTRFSIKDIIICCQHDNIGSRRIIEKCGGKLVSSGMCHNHKHELLRFIISESIGVKL